LGAPPDLPLAPSGPGFAQVLAGAPALGAEPHRPEHLVHGEKRARHARGRLEEAAAAHVEPPCVVVGELADAPFDLSLLLALRRRVVLAVRDYLGWNRRGIADVELICV